MVSVNHISNGTIEEIRFDNNVAYITISYIDFINRRRTERTLTLAAGRNTTILDERGNFVPASTLRTGMMINAVTSSTMTRSIPPQTSAFLIRILSRPLSDVTTGGRIVDIDRQNRSFTAIADGNLSSVTRYNVDENARIIGRNGRPMNFSMLMPGMRVRIRHAAFMTASIPPQTTAFEIRVL